MKTKILLITFLLISSGCYSQTSSPDKVTYDKVSFSGSVKLGYEQARTIIYPSDNMIRAGFFPYYDQNAMYGRIKVNANYKGFCAYISNKTYFQKQGYGDADFQPIQIEFVTGATYTLNKTISVNWEHMCSHGIEQRLFHAYYDDFGIEFKF
jgi:hypothetical protein